MSVFKRRRFPAEIILLCVRWYCRYGISYRDLEEMMGERGVAVDHVTLYRWIQRYAPELEESASNVYEWVDQIVDNRLRDSARTSRQALLSANLRPMVAQYYP